MSHSPEPNHRVHQAGARARDAYTSVTRIARKLEAEIEEVTETRGIPVAPLDPEDSMVVAVVAVIAANER